MRHQRLGVERRMRRLWVYLLTMLFVCSLGIPSIMASDKPLGEPFGLVTSGNKAQDPPPVARLWYAKESQSIVKANNCHAMSQDQHNYPFYQLLTPEILVTWCIENTRQGERPPDFHLVIIPRFRTHPWASCPRFFPMTFNSDPSYVWIEQPPTINGQPWPLNHMAYQDDDEGVMKPGPKKGYATGPSLWYGLLEDSGGFLYCHEHESEWLTGGHQ